MEGHAMASRPGTRLASTSTACRAAAELARQRPLGAGASVSTRRTPARRGGARHLLHLLDRVHREHADAELVGARDVALLLDRVAEGDAVGGGAGGQGHLDLGDGSRVEARAHRGEQREDLGRRVRLYGIEDARLRQRLLEGTEIVAHDVEIDHEAGTFGTSGGEEIEDFAGGHRFLPSRLSGARKGCVLTGRRPREHAVDKGEAGARGADGWRCRNHGSPSRGGELKPCPAPARFVCLGLDGKSPTALPAMKVCLFSNPDLWTIGRHQKGPHRRCFKTSSDRRLAA